MNCKEVKQKSFESKLKTYTSVAAGVVASAGIANAQIVYTDIDPDIMISDSSYLIDLNNDANADFRLIHLYYYYSNSILNAIGLEGLNINEALGDTILSTSYSYVSFYPAMLNANDDISENKQVWYYSSYALMYYNGVYGSYTFKGGNWKSTTDKFLGLRFKMDGKWHYGWARIDITAKGEAFIIKDYAYESYPEKHILAGAQVSSVADDAARSVRVFNGPKNLIINTNGVEVADNKGIIHNTLGQKIQSLQLKAGKNVIPLDGFVPGVYLVNMTVNGQPISRKFMVR
ncbi:MAG: T9SS type A sorting domain-containing protein [Bacteroidetes bacterium]|nr:T9SS type A sorting domain-containing protein [Bacteroidota bacterium]